MNPPKKVDAHSFYPKERVECNPIRQLFFTTPQPPSGERISFSIRAIGHGEQGGRRDISELGEPVMRSGHNLPPFAAVKSIAAVVVREAFQVCVLHSQLPEIVQHAAQHSSAVTLMLMIGMHGEQVNETKLGRAIHGSRCGGDDRAIGLPHENQLGREHTVEAGVPARSPIAAVERAEPGIEFLEPGNRFEAVDDHGTQDGEVGVGSQAELQRVHTREGYRIANGLPNAAGVVV